MESSSIEPITTGTASDLAASGARPALQLAAAALRSGWTMLQDCSFGSEDGSPPAQAVSALLHPHVGVAFLDLLPCGKDSDAVHQLRAALDAAGFPETFDGYPPIVHLHMPAHALRDLGTRLDRAFDRARPLALRGGDAWVNVVRSVLAGHLVTPLALGAITAAGTPRIRSSAAWQDLTKAGAAPKRTPRRVDGMRALGLFWSGILLVLGGGVAILQYLGPPDDHVVVHDVPAVMPSPRAMQQDAKPAEDIAPADATTRHPLAPVQAASSPGGWGPNRSRPAILVAGRAEGAPGGDGISGGASAPTPSLVALLRELNEPEPVPPDATIAKAGAQAARRAATPAGPASSLPPTPAPDASQAEQLADAASSPSPTQGDMRITRPAPPPTSQQHGGAVSLPHQPIKRPQVLAERAGDAPTSLTLPSQPAASPDAARPRNSEVLPADHAKLAVARNAPLDAATGPSVVPPATVKAGAAALSPAVLEMLMHRGDVMLAAGDISAARLLYARAAASGLARAAIALGRTHDPVVLAQIRADLSGDKATADEWYRRAAALVEVEAQSELARSEAVGGAN